MVVSANRWLSNAEQIENARYIWNKLRAFGWSENAVAALLGNTQVESGHNPGIWEGLNPNNPSRGFGLVQYTPATMLLDHASSVGRNAGSMDFQLELIDNDHFGHWIPTSAYNFSYSTFKTSTQSEVTLADAFLKNFERPANQHQPDRGRFATQWLKVFTKTSSNTPEIVQNRGNIERVIEWMEARRGKVTYSMAYRNGPNSYDCSSAVFNALKYAGFPIPFVGNTETLYSMEGDLLIPIQSSQKRRGDIFVSGAKGGSNNAYGHTGFCLNETQAIHCSSFFNGIGISSNADTAVRAYAGAPVYWYRVAGSNLASPTPDSSDADGGEDKNIYITSVNDDKEYIEQPQLVELFGRRYKEETFDNVESPNDLLQRAKDWLATQPLDIASVTLDFIQLDKIDQRYKELRAGDVVTVRNDELNINIRMRIESKSFSLEEPEQGSLELGRQSILMSDWVSNPSLINNLNTRGR